MLKLGITNTLYLQQLRVKDSESVYNLINENRIHLRTFLNWVDSTRSVRDVKAFIKGTILDHKKDGSSTFGIRENGRLIGVIGHALLDSLNNSASFGYWISQSNEGRGIVTRACRVFLKHSFDSLKLNRLELCCAVKNLKSEAVAKRLGFRYEGVRRQGELVNGEYLDMKVYSMLVDEFNSVRTDKSV